MKTLVKVLCSVLLILSSGFTDDNEQSSSHKIQDDTRTLQALLTSGEAKLPKGKTYNVSSGLVLTKSIDLNGDIINYTGSAGVCIRIPNQNVTLQNGKITGTWDDQSPNSTVGPTGILLTADNCTISHLRVAKFATYGICITSHDKPAITGCHLSEIGYIGIYYTADGARPTIGGQITKDTVDRSTISPGSIHMPAISIRGQTVGMKATTSGWTIANNVIKKPLNPTDWAAECLEVRAMGNSMIADNTFIGGSIATSLVRSTGMTLARNNISNAQLEGIEVADCTEIASANNTITGGIGLGFLFDGPVGSKGTTSTGDKISGIGKDCIQTFAGTQNLKIVNSILVAANGAKALNLLGSSGVTITGSTITGENTSKTAV